MSHKFRVPPYGIAYNTVLGRIEGVYVVLGSDGELEGGFLHDLAELMDRYQIDHLDGEYRLAGDLFTARNGTVRGSLHEEFEVKLLGDQNEQ